MSESQAVIDAYLSAYRRLHGEEAAEKIALHYALGWYYLASRVKGLIGIWHYSKPTPYRRRAIEEFTARLEERAKLALDNAPEKSYNERDAR